MNVRRTQTGFTIIEIVLVVAIAGLIFLVVFLALPALQTAQRNHQRRQHAGEFLAALEQYRANNGGRILRNSNGSPQGRAEGEVVTNAVMNSYLTPESKIDPLTGEEYEAGYGPSIDGFGYIDWSLGNGCAESGGVHGGNLNDWRNGNDALVSVVIGLEPGDSAEDNWLPGRPVNALYYCVDNQ